MHDLVSFFPLRVGTLCSNSSLSSSIFVPLDRSLNFLSFNEDKTLSKKQLPFLKVQILNNSNDLLVVDFQA